MFSFIQGTWCVLLLMATINVIVIDFIKVVDFNLPVLETRGPPFSRNMPSLQNYATTQCCHTFWHFLGPSCWPGTPPTLILLRPRSPYVTGLFRQWPGCWDCFAPKVFGWERWILIPRQAAAPSSYFEISSTKRGFSPTRSSMRMDWQNVQNSWSLLQLKCFESYESYACHVVAIYHLSIVFTCNGGRERRIQVLWLLRCSWCWVTKHLLKKKRQ